MRFSPRTFWLAKDAESPSEYQDSFDLDSERGLAAIADGVSSTLFSGPWARLLTSTAVVQPPQLEDTAAFTAWLADLRAAWIKGIDVSRLSFFQRAKLREMTDGAMSTLLWLEFLGTEGEDSAAGGEYRLRAYSIGDCSLFQVRDGHCLASFPMADSAEFGLSPDVVCSIGRNLDHLMKFKAQDFTCRPDDLLVLCTDAIGLWAMNRQEAGDPVDWERYWDLSNETWRAEIFSLRRESLMRVDDSTLVLLRVAAVAPEPGSGGVDSADTSSEWSTEPSAPDSAAEACVEASLECDEAGGACDDVATAENIHGDVVESTGAESVAVESAAMCLIAEPVESTDPAESIESGDAVSEAPHDDPEESKPTADAGRSDSGP